MSGRKIGLRGRVWTVPERIFAGISGVMAAGFVLTLAIWAVDSRQIDGLSVWAKPLKFQLALAVHAATLALVVSRLGPAVRAGRFIHGTALAFLLACSVEMGWIILQAALGQHSHFNDSTALHRAMFSVMAFAAVIITGAAAAVAAAVWRDRFFAAGATVKTGIILGLTGGTVLTLVTAFTIGAWGGPYVGDIPVPADRMMFTGWSMGSGDLRVAHFLATHMMQAVPVAAILGAILVAKSRIGARAAYVVYGFAAFWGGWTLAEYGIALSGRPALVLMLFD